MFFNKKDFVKKVDNKKEQLNRFGCKVCKKDKSDYSKSLFFGKNSNAIDILFLIDDYSDRQIYFLQKVITRDKNCMITPIVKCGSYDDEALECCRNEVVKEIEKVNPKIIIALGQKSFRWMTSVYYQLKLWRGRVVPFEIFQKSYWIMPCSSIKTILDFDTDYNKAYENIFKVDLKKVYQFLEKYERPKILNGNDHSGIEIITGREKGDLERLKTRLRHFKTFPYVSIDIENKPLKPWNNGCKMISIAIGTDKEVVAFPVERDDCWKNQDEVLDLLLDFLLSSGEKICHNLKHELTWFNWYFGQEVLRETKWHDTLSQAYVLDNRTSKERNQGMFGLGKLTKVYFGFNLKDLADIDFRKIEEEPIEKVLLYNARDTKWTHKIFLKQKELLDESLQSIYDFHIEDAKTVALMETEGLKVDHWLLNAFGKNFVERTNLLIEKISKLDEVKKYKKKKGNFNVNSSTQIGDILKNFYKLSPYRVTGKSGNFSTDDESLKYFKNNGNKFCEYILDYRSLNKLNSTYVKGIKSVIHDDDRLHPQFNSHQTSTGRKSSDSPNAQNFPKRKNAFVRNIIIPEKDYCMVAVDYGQLEFRGIGMATKDEALEKAIKDGYDVHRYWAMQVLKRYHRFANVSSFSEIDEFKIKKVRSRVKNLLVFPWFYGAGKQKVSTLMGIPIEIVEDLSVEFWKMFSTAKKWQKETLNFYDRNGYSQILSGRRAVGSNGSMSEVLRYNEIINFPIQGACSDIVCDAMNRLSQLAYELKDDRFQPIINIHDDITFTKIPKNELDESIEIIAKEMCRKTFDFIGEIPLQVEISVGDRWGKLKEILVKDTRDFNYS